MRALRTHVCTTAVFAALSAGLVAAPPVRPAAPQGTPAAPVAPVAAPPVASLYANAIAEEAAVRKALAQPRPAPTLLKAVRTAVADFEAVVRQYPTSSYCDDALWRAARLSADAFDRFHEPRESTTAGRLFRQLSSEYPSSRFARQVPVQLSQLAARVAASSQLARQADAPPSAEAPGRTDAAPTGTAPAPAAPTTGVGPGTPPAPGPHAAIRDIRRIVLPDVVRVVIELDREVSFHNERIAGPDRVFVDLSPTRSDFALMDRTLRYDGDADIVGQIRIGRHPNQVTRVVLDADGISSYSVYPLYSPFRLVIDCLRDRADAAEARREPSATPAVRPAAAAAAAAVPAPARASTAAPSAGTPAAVPISMARQLGLGVSRIVIDPGHGGHDPGARGPGLTEAELVLDVALRLEKLLKKLENVDVVLTRRTNEFVALEERTAIANREGADLFLSIHVNSSSSPSARGVETYFLDFATTQAAAAVAARENATSAQTMGSLQDVVKAITLNNKLDESRDFAAHVHREMVRTLKNANRNVRDHGIKQAPFVVLIGAGMPSVLAEVSFLSNADEARLLKSGAYRQRIAQALFDGIGKYQRSLKPWPSVAQQQDQ